MPNRSPLGGDLWSTTEEHGHCKELAGSLLEEISLQDQRQWATQVVEGLACMETSFAVDSARVWTTRELGPNRRWFDEIEVHLNVIEVHLGQLKNLLEEF